MRRLKAKSLPGPSGHVHVMSRCVQGRYLLGEQEQIQFRQMLGKAVRFSGLRMLTFCIMSNHFHVLIEVPREAPEVGDGELVERYATLYGDTVSWRTGKNRGGNLPTPEALSSLLEKGDEAAKVWRTRLLRRMHSVPEFMRTLKLRYSTWYNRTHDTYGTFWASRYHAVWVDGEHYALQAVAAYIDMNPVRAGLVVNPGTYAHSGFGEAMAGNKESRETLARVMTSFGHNTPERFQAYASLLLSKSEQRLDTCSRILEDLGVRTRRLSSMTRGLALGSAAFVRGLIAGSKVNGPVFRPPDDDSEDGALFSARRTR